MSPPTLVHALADKLDAFPGRPLYTFLDVNGREVDELDYLGVVRRAAGVAAALRERGVNAGDRVLLVYPPEGMDFIAGFFGCLLIGAVAVPASSPDPRHLERDLPGLRHIAADCEAAVVLSHATYRRLGTLFSARDALRGLLRGRLDRPDWPDLPWISGDRIPAAPEAEARALLQEATGTITADTLAFLQYTSGSTSRPRGVRVRHRNAVHNVTVMARNSGVNAESVLVGWVPVYHDMGLTGGILNAVCTGARCIGFSPMSFLRRPELWLEALTRYRGTHAAGPNFGYAYTLRGLRPDASYDLSAWRVALQGGEPLRARTIEQVGRALAPHGFSGDRFANIYGMAETVLFVSGRVDAPPTFLHLDSRALEVQGRVVVQDRADATTRTLIGCGVPDAEHGVHIRVVDPHTCRACATDRVGELWLQSPSNADGYWGHPKEANDARFRARIEGEPDAGPFLRTGDLGFVHGGEVFLCGRHKDLLILAGRNVYPQDLEATIEEAHPRIRRGNVACFGVEVEGEERLVVVAEVKAPDGAEAVVDAIRAQVAEAHGLPCHQITLIRKNTLPKTTSGKVQRSRTRECWRQQALEVVHASAIGGGPATIAPPWKPDADEADLPLVDQIRHEAARLLGLDPDRVGPDSSLRALGMDSIQAMDLHDALEARTGAALPMATLFERPTPRGLAEAVQAARPASSPPTSSLTDATILPLSTIQAAIWHDHHARPGSHITTTALRITGPCTPDHVARALRDLLARHPLLRTAFPDADRAEVHTLDALDPAPLVEPADLSDAELFSRMAADVRTPLDAARAPLLRARIFPRSDALILQLTAHHLIYDAVSITRLQEELIARLGAIAGGDDLDQDAATGPDYRAWLDRERAYLASPTAAEDRAWWMHHLAGAELDPIPGPLPADSVQQSVSAVLDRAATDTLLAAADAHGVTLFTLLLADYCGALADALDRGEICLGTTVSLRGRALADVLGPLFNYVVLRVPSSDRTPDALLQAAHQAVQGALAHARTPFQPLVDELTGDPSGVRLGLSANLNLYDLDAMARSSLTSRLRAGPVDVGPLQVQALPMSALPVVRPYTLQCGVVREGGRLTVGLRYAPALVDEARARLILDGFTARLAARAPGLRSEA